MPRQQYKNKTKTENRKTAKKKKQNKHKNLAIFAIGEKNIATDVAGLGEADKRQTQLKPTAIGAIGGAAGETGN